MNLIRNQSVSKVVLCFLLGLIGLSALGCSSQAWRLPKLRWGSKSDSKSKSGLRVVPMASRYIANLSSDDIVKMMRQAGFTDIQILDIGTDLRDALMTSGAATIKNKVTEASFGVNGDYVYITVRRRGSFIYDIKRGTFKIGAATGR